MLCLLASLCFLHGTAWAKDKQPKALSDWNTRLQTLQTHLIAGEHRKALDIALPLQREMLDRIESGPGAAGALSVTALSRALAEAGLGDMEAAAWDWYTALTLDPTGPGVLRAECELPGAAPLHQAEVKRVPPFRAFSLPLIVPLRYL